jgi:hypothetical protein
MKSDLLITLLVLTLIWSVMWDYHQQTYHATQTIDPPCDGFVYGNTGETEWDYLMITQGPPVPED